MIRSALLIIATLLVSVALPVATTAQNPASALGQAERVLGRPLTDAEVLELLRRAALSATEVRQRLGERGLDPTSADPYLRVLDGEASSVPAETNPIPLLAVLAELGTRDPNESRIARDVVLPPPGETTTGPPIFGLDLFSRATSEFEPVITGPVPPDYRVGPGDEVVLVLTGGVQQAYRLGVTREGWIVIPDVGRISVNGSTLSQLEALLFQRLSQVYSGITRGSDATTFFDVTVGRLRTNQVYAIGEVARPGAYTVSSLATVLNALYRAGGPNRGGSFRSISVSRRGSLAAEIDLYDYLLRGDAARDIRLENGDVLFVPVAGTRVEISGPVVRPGIYEVRKEEDLRALIRMAGGLEASAEPGRVQIERILPLEDRSPGQDRAIIDVPLPPLDGETGGSIPIRDGDRITVFAVLEELRNRVVLGGGVWRPGTYAADGDTRLWDLIERAGGLVPDALEGRAQIQRLQRDYTRRLIPVSLARDGSGAPLENPMVEGLDQILIFARRDLRETRTVSVGGWVRESGTYPFQDGMTVADLLLLAGGLRNGAYLAEAEVSRLMVAQERSDTLVQRLGVSLDSAFVFAADGSGEPIQTAIGDTEAANFRLDNLDALYVRRVPGFTPQQRVTIAGEVRFPGPYSIERRTERIADLIARAGGLTGNAYTAGFQLWRVRSASAPAAASPPVDRVRVGVDLASALSDPTNSANLLLEPSDSVFVPRYIPTVEVEGAVVVPTQVLHRPGASVDYYVRGAGGYREDADRDRVRLRFANGEVASKGGGFLFFGGGMPDPDPGSVVTVPAKAPREETGLRVSEFVGLFSTVLTAAAAVIIAANR